MASINGLDDQVYHTKFNPLFKVPLGGNPPEEINMLVETPHGSINKYEYHTQTGMLKLDRVLFKELPYPFEYGAAPQTWDEDEDMLDIMCLTKFPTFPGCLLSVRPVGVMYYEDTGDRDDKILAVPANDIRFAHINDLADVTEHQKDEIIFFFERYKDLQFKYQGQTDKKLVVKGWGDKKAAFKVIDEAHALFKERFRDELPG